MSDADEVYSVTDSFNHEMIGLAGTDVSDKQEEQLREFIEVLFEEEAGISVTDDVKNMALLAFVAGRTYEKQFANTDELIPMVFTLRQLAALTQAVLNMVQLGGQS